jgi:hypothetical protein
MAAKSTQKPSAPVAAPVTLLVATRKGAFFIKTDKTRKAWKIRGPVFLGHIVHHVLLDPRDQRTLLLAARTGLCQSPRRRERPGCRSHLLVDTGARE